MLSLHLKATMMKVSDPIMFGHCIKVFFKEAFQKHGETLEKIGANPNSGLANIYARLEKAAKKGILPKDQADLIKSDFEACYEHRPWLAMVNSDKGITNLHGRSCWLVSSELFVCFFQLYIHGLIVDTLCLSTSTQRYYY